MTTTAVDIRLIEAEDLPVVTDIHMLAFPRAAMTSLGKEAVRRYYLWQMEGPNDLYATLAEVDGRVAGFSFGGHFRGATIGYLRRNRTFLILNALRKPWLLANPVFLEGVRKGLDQFRRKRGQPIPRKTAAEPRRFGVLALAVHPAFQGRGIGHALMDDAEREARRLGVSRMHLTVHPDNTPAVRFYEIRGWHRTLDDRGRWAGYMIKDLETPATGR
jgi:ribosomal protein S18 acetylase RimI-like enzyme